MAVTSYGRNKNHDDEIKKNQEKANNSLGYRCAAIKNMAVNNPALQRSGILKLARAGITERWNLMESPRDPGICQDPRIGSI